MIDSEQRRIYRGFTANLVGCLIDRESRPYGRYYLVG